MLAAVPRLAELTTRSRPVPLSHSLPLRRRMEMNDDMLERSNSPRSDVHVIGGGLGGLAVAALIARAGRTVTVHEARGRLGGRGTTERKNGFRLNQGPHALYRAGEANRVLRSLGIVASGQSPNLRGALLADGDRVGLSPGGPLSLLRSPLLGWRDKYELAKVLARIDRFDPSGLATVSARDWVDSAVSRERVRDIVHTVIRLATYTNMPDELSAEVALMQVQLALGDGVIYLDRGWEQLVEALAQVPGVRHVRDHHVGEFPDAACVIVATGNPRATANLLGVPFDVGPCAEVSVLDVGLARPPRHGFVLGIDPPMYLSNHGFPDGMTPKGASLVSVAEYLSADTEPDRARLEAYLVHAGVDTGAVVTERYLHRMPAVSAIATAAAGGLRGRPRSVVGDRPGVFIVGDWVGPRGHLLDAVLASAHDAALGAISYLERRPVMR